MQPIKRGMSKTSSDRCIRARDFLAEGDSFHYYQFLPSDARELEDDWPSVDLVAIGRRLSAPGWPGPGAENDLDALTCSLFAHGANSLPRSVDWHSLADSVSMVYARQLKSDGVRSLRMKAARANFFLRDLMDVGRDVADGYLGERRFARGFTWDWLPWREGEVIADSGAENVHYHPPGADKDVQSLALGLPTQFDVLTHAHIAVTSCYSPGWHEWMPGNAARFHAHHCPVTLSFSLGNDRFFLDRNGAVFHLGSDKPICRLPVDAVWRARLVEGKVFVSDWSEPRRITVLDTDGWGISIVDSGPVLLMNDLCKVDATYYVIDKMQGRIFSYDERFMPKEARMSFGKGAGRLYDPITLRFHHGNLRVLSWLTGALAEIKAF